MLTSSSVKVARPVGDCSRPQVFVGVAGLTPAAALHALLLTDVDLVALPVADD